MRKLILFSAAMLFASGAAYAQVGGTADTAGEATGNTAGSLDSGVNTDLGGVNANTQTRTKTDLKARGSVDMEQRFNEVDANGDGQISKAEARADSKLNAAFDEADASGDGNLNRSEFESALSASGDANAETSGDASASGEGAEAEGSASGSGSASAEGEAEGSSS